MKGKVPIVLGAIVAFIVVLEIIFVSFTLFRSNNSLNQTNGNSTQPTMNVDDSSVTLLTIITNYPDFFPTDSKCRKSYEELFGKEDGYFRKGSPCTITLTFTHKGFAEKTIDLQRWDKEKKTLVSTEKIESKGTISPEQFTQIKNSIVNSETFKNWNDAVSIAASNTKITVQHSHGARMMMSNVDEKTTAFLPLLDAFKKLDNEVKWDK